MFNRGPPPRDAFHAPFSLLGVTVSEQNGWERIHGFQQCHVRPRLQDWRSLSWDICTCDREGG